MIPLIAAALPSISGFLANKGLKLLSGIFKGSVNAGVQSVANKIKDKTGIDINQIVNDNITPEQLEKLKKFEFDYELELSKIALEQLQIVNQTMQAESKSEHWPQYSWRPFWGFMSGLSFLGVTGFCCYLAYISIAKNSPTAMAMIPQLVTAFTPLFGIACTVLGVSSWHRGKEKIEKLKLNI